MRLLRGLLGPGRPCFTVYNAYKAGFFSNAYAQRVLGELDPHRHYYRVGYCPAVVEGDFVKAQTLLMPGMRGIPEAEAMRRASLPGPLKKQMAEQVERLTIRELHRTGDFSLVRWFHENAAPQVVVLDQEVFRYD